MGRLVILLALIAVFSGCTNRTDTSTDIDVSRPAQDIEQKAEDSKDSARQIEGELPDLTWKPDAPEVESSPPDTDPKSPEVKLKPHTQNIKSNSDDIINTASVLADTQADIDNLTQEVENARDEDAERMDWYWNWLKIAGVTIGSIGALAAGYAAGPATGVAVALGGWTLAASAKFAQDYLWVPMLVIGVAVFAGLCYAAYYIWLMRDTIFKEKLGLTPGKQGKKLQAEIQHKVDKKKRKLEKKKTKLETDEAAKDE